MALALMVPVVVPVSVPFPANRLTATAVVCVVETIVGLPPASCVWTTTEKAEAAVGVTLPFTLSTPIQQSEPGVMLKGLLIAVGFRRPLFVATSV